MEHARHAGPPQILVVDDTPEDIRPLLVRLKAQPWRISLATDPRQAYQRALALQPDLILLDVRMPQMDGFTLGRLLREAPATRRVPIIFLTSAGALEERLEGLSLGGVDYVMKSCEPDEVLARIQVHLRLVWRDEAPARPEVEPEPLPADEVILRAALRLIGQQLDALPSLVDLARRVGTHDKRLSAIFRERLGMTVFAYAREMRLRRGQELLAESGMSVQDIAEVLGFRSACNFTTAFRERHGITPTQYRRQWQDGDDADAAPSA